MTEHQATSPMAGIAAMHLLLARHPLLADLPLSWSSNREYGAMVSIVSGPGVNDTDVVSQFAAITGAKVVTGRPFESRLTGRTQGLYATVHVDGVDIELAAFVPAALMAETNAGGEL